MTSTLASPSARRDAIGSGPNAEKSGQKTAPRLQRAERRHVELGNATGQHEHAIALADAEAQQHVGEAAGARAQLAVAEILERAALAEPAHGEVSGAWTGGMTVDGFVRDVQPPAARQPVERPTGLGPGKVGTDALVVVEVGQFRRARRVLRNRGIHHTSLMRPRAAAVAAAGPGPLRCWAAMRRSRTGSARRDGSVRTSHSPKISKRDTVTGRRPQRNSRIPCVHDDGLAHGLRNDRDIVSNDRATARFQREFRGLIRWPHAGSRRETKTVLAERCVPRERLRSRIVAIQPNEGPAAE